MVAFAHRIGFPSVNFARALGHPAIFESGKGDFEHLVSIGTKVVQYFASEYVNARFPKLKGDYLSIAKGIYTNPRGLANMARKLGMEYPLCDFHGLPTIEMRPLKKLLIHLGRKAEPVDVLAQCYLAMIGLLAKQPHGAQAVKTFLDSYLFTGSFVVTQVVEPSSPIVALTEALREEYKNPTMEPEFRILHESGRNSNNAMFVVGLFVQDKMMAEGYGPSLLLAQKRAATEAIRRLYLHEDHDAKRPSDIFFNKLSLHRILGNEED